MTFTARPPAKVNLTLEVLGRRADGCHELRSVFLRIGLCDALSLDVAQHGSDALRVTGLPGTPTADNLVLRALGALRTRSNVALPPLKAHLDKRIPLAAGLGGGSSDCAATLGLAQACWGVRLARADESALAAELGSDVPFFQSDAPAALVEGSGEQVTALEGVRGEAGVLLATPPAHLSTTEVFARHDGLPDKPGPADAGVSRGLATALGDGLDADGLCAWADRLREANDLWPAAVEAMPELLDLRGALERFTTRPWLLSGSGPTLFALYPSLAEAHSAGVAVATAASAQMRDVVLHAVDLVGPDPAWRYP
jgi:4-diphosphocytidyl-2-C-methyl-D-erythritol kinase